MKQYIRRVIGVLGVFSACVGGVCQASIQSRTLTMSAITLTNGGLLKAEQGWFPRLEKLENSGSIFIERVWINQGAVVSFANISQLTIESRAVTVSFEGAAPECTATFIASEGAGMDRIKIDTDAQSGTLKLCLDADAGQVKIAVPQTCSVIVNSPPECLVVDAEISASCITHVDKAELRTHVEPNGAPAESKPLSFEPVLPKFSTPSWQQQKAWSSTVAPLQDSDFEARRAERAARMAAEQKAQEERKIREKKAAKKDAAIFAAIAVPVVTLTFCCFGWQYWQNRKARS
jgi:hypothetical protein